MITCEFKTKGDVQSSELMDKFCNTIQNWLEDERKELVFCRWEDKEGYHVSVSAGDKSDLHISINHTACENDEKCYTVTLSLKGEEKQITVPADVDVKVYHDKQHKETIESGNAESEAVFSQTHNTAKELWKEYERHYRNEGYVTGLSTGFFDLDYRTRGLHDRELVLIAGNERREKLGFALSIIHNVLRNHGTTVIFSLSLTRRQILNNLIAINLGVNPRGIETQVPENELRNRTRLLEFAHLYVDDNSSITIDMIRKTCFKLSRKTKLDLVVIDYLELINDDTKSGDDRSTKLRKLKSFSRDIHCPVLVLSELRFNTLKEWADRSDMRSLPEFDESQKYPDVMLLLYPDEGLNNKRYGNEKGVAELIVINQGEYDGRVRLLTDLGGLRFKNMLKPEADT